jgi:uncharacterized protein (TIGR03083 family)
VDLSSRQLDELLGSWALEALDPDEAALVDAALARDPALARRAASLRQVVALMGESMAAAPPPALRAPLLQRAAAAPRPDPAAASDPVTVFANQVAALTELLATVDGEEWHLPVEPYRWTVIELVAHLAVIERYTAHQLGIAPSWSPAGPTGHLEIGADQIAAAGRRPPAETVTLWREAAQATVDAARSEHAPALDAAVELHGWPFTTATALIARAFEIWTHGDDIRRATGRSLLAPEPADLRAMSSFSVGSLPLLVPVVAPDAPFEGGRVVLTGTGGGTYDLGDRSRRQFVLVADVVDYCRLAARRLPAGELDAAIEGDEQAAAHLLGAAQLFAI